MFTWSRAAGRHSRSYQEGNLPGGEIIILQTAQGGEFTCWEGSAVSEMQSWLARARAENCGGGCVCVCIVPYIKMLLNDEWGFNKSWNGGIHNLMIEHYIFL